MSIDPTGPTAGVNPPARFGVGERAGLPRPSVLPLAASLALFIVLLRPVYDVDIFWQLNLAELILATRGRVPTEPFAATPLGEPLPPLAWLGQAVYAAVRSVGGWPVLRAFDALL